MRNFPCRAEVQQLCAAVLHYHYVVRAYVAVYYPLRMNVLQGRHNGHKQLNGLLRCKAALLLKIGFQVNAVQKVHYYICRAVFFAEIAHAHYAGFPVKLRQYAGFVQKLFPVLFKCVPVGAKRCKYVGRCVVVAIDVAGHIEFLYGYLQIQHRVYAYIGYAEAAFAKHAAYFVALLHKRARHKMVRHYGIAVHVKAALCAYAVFKFRIPQTARAELYIMHKLYLPVSYCCYRLSLSTNSNAATAIMAYTAVCSASMPQLRQSLPESCT